jgi:hypothetical protein
LVRGAHLPLGLVQILFLAPSLQLEVAEVEVAPQTEKTAALAAGEVEALLPQNYRGLATRQHSLRLKETMAEPQWQDFREQVEVEVALERLVEMPQAETAELEVRVLRLPSPDHRLLEVVAGVEMECRQMPLEELAGEARQETLERLEL